MGTTLALRVSPRICLSRRRPCRSRWRPAGCEGYASRWRCPGSRAVRHRERSPRPGHRRARRVRATAQPWIMNLTRVPRCLPCERPASSRARRSVGVSRPATASPIEPCLTGLELACRVPGGALIIARESTHAIDRVGPSGGLPRQAVGNRLGSWTLRATLLAPFRLRWVGLQPGGSSPAGSPQSSGGKSGTCQLGSDPWARVGGSSPPSRA